MYFLPENWRFALKSIKMHVSVIDPYLDGMRFGIFLQILKVWVINLFHPAVASPVQKSCTDCTIARWHSVLSAVQRCALPRQAIMHHFHGQWDTSGLRSICELLFFVLYVIYMKYGIHGIKSNGITNMDLFIDFEFWFICMICMELGLTLLLHDLA